MPALRISVGLVVNPRIHGLSASSRMEAQSAPSAKILTRNEATSGIARHSHWHASMSAPKNPLRGFAQRADSHERPIGTLFGVAVVDEDRATAGAVAGFDVAPTVANNIAGLQIDIPNAGRFEQQARLRLAAGATRGVVVRAEAHAVQLQEALQALVHLGDLFGRDQATRDVRLICDQDQREPSLAQSAAGFANARQQSKIGEGRGRVWFALAQDGAIHDAVAIQKHGTAHYYILPRRASATNALSDTHRAWRVLRLHVQPRERMRSVFKRTTGTSPFQPRSPPVYSRRTW